MKIYLFLLIFFLISSCSSNNGVYWCGDHPCINKKEKEAYFKKTMIVEIKQLKKENYKHSSEVEKLLAQAHIDEKKRIKDEKELAKQARLEEKRRIKDEKDLLEEIKMEEENQIPNKKKVINKKIFKKENKLPNKNMDLSKFNELVEKIITRNSSRSYPDINNVPN